MARFLLLCIVFLVCLPAFGIADCEPPGVPGDDAASGLLSGNALASITPTSIGDAKKAGVGAYVVLLGKVVTTGQLAPTDGFYVQEKDRSSGILVLPPVASAPRTEMLLSPNAEVNLSGAIATNGAELYLVSDAVVPTGGTYVARPLGMPDRSIGGVRFGSQPGTFHGSSAECSCGLNNVGLLVETWEIANFRQGTVGDPTHAVGVVGGRLADGTTTCFGEPAVERELRTRAVMDAGAPVSNAVALPTSPIEAVITWETAVETSSVLDVHGVARVFRSQTPIAEYVQAVCYTPGEHKFLCADLIDQDLRDIRDAGANAINLYGLIGDDDAVWNPLAREDDKGCHSSLQEHLLAACGDLKVIARLESYDPKTFRFTLGDASAVLRHYMPSIEMLKAFRDRGQDRLLYYLINMPLDDRDVNKERTWFPTAAVQRDYAQYLCHLVKEAHPGALVRATLHYSVLDNIPAAPLMGPATQPERETLDGVALVAYPGRCSSSPFTSGLAFRPCEYCPVAGDGPNAVADPAHVVIGADQLNYWLEKARKTNWPEQNATYALAMDGVGLPDRLGHWSGIVSDMNTKVQGARYLADYLRTDSRTDGFSYFMLQDKEEGTFGIVDRKHVRESGAHTSHRVTLRDLWPGCKYTVRIIGDGGHAQLTFDTPFRCDPQPLRWLDIETPGCGGVLLDSSATAYTVTWKSNLSEDTQIRFYADADDRGRNGESIGQGTVDADGGGSAVLSLNGLAYGGYHIYGEATVTDCSLPGSVIWAYSPGRIVRPFADAMVARRTSGPIDVNGQLDEADWSNAGWVPYAAHSDTATAAQAAFAWDSDYLYVAFRVTDEKLEADPDFEWDGDSVSVFLWAGTPMDSRTDIAAFVRESRRGPCEGGSAGSLGRGITACSVTGGDTCDTATGYTVEMSIPWDEVHIIPLVETVISADLLSTDHVSSRNACREWWDGGPDDWLGGAIILSE